MAFEFGTNPLYIQTVRDIIDGGDNLTEDKILKEAKKKYPKMTSTDVSEALGELLTGGIYNRDGGTYSRKGS